MERRLKPGNSSYHSVQALSSSHTLSKNLKIITHKIIIVSVVLFCCETWVSDSKEGTMAKSV
jgi:hypothetical protein